MKNTHLHILACFLLLASTGELSAEREPLPRPVLKKIDYQPTGTRLRPDPKTGQPAEYELDGRITYDKGSGNFLLSWNGADGQRKTIVYEPATRLDALVAGSVEFDSELGSYRYSYVLSNLGTSSQKLQTIYIETRAPITNVNAPDTTWYSVPLTDYLREELDVKGGWTWAQTMHGRVGLHPGQEASGFTYMSSGLPTVVKCYVRPRGVLKGVGEELPEELHAAIDRVAWKIPQGWTVGPTAIPRRIEPARFARNMIEMLQVSQEQGWIESPEVAAEFQAGLKSAVASLERGDNRQASRLLNVLLRRVEEENGRALLSEAYALLRFNLEYLDKQILTK